MLFLLALQFNSPYPVFSWMNGLLSTSQWDALGSMIGGIGTTVTLIYLVKSNKENEIERLFYDISDLSVKLKTQLNKQLKSEYTVMNIFEFAEISHNNLISFGVEFNDKLYEKLLNRTINELIVKYNSFSHCSVDDLMNYPDKFPYSSINHICAQQNTCTKLIDEIVVMITRLDFLLTRVTRIKPNCIGEINSIVSMSITDSSINMIKMLTNTGSKK